MTWSLVCAGVWFIVASFAALIPSNDNHWRRAYVLMTIGAPLLVWVFYENNWQIGLLVVLGMVSIFRWPVYYLWRYIRNIFHSKGADND